MSTLSLIAAWLAAGWLAAAVLHAARRSSTAWPFRNAQAWLAWHRRSGLLALAAMFVHAGAVWPGTSAGRWLVGAGLWVAASGVLLVVVQRVGPRRVARAGALDLPAAQVASAMNALPEDAFQAVQGASEPLGLLYERAIRPALTTRRLSLHESARVMADASQSIERLTPFLPPDDQRRAQALTTVVERHHALRVRRAVDRWLTASIWVHVVPVGLLVALVAVHLWAVWYY